ncbi:MAG: lysophospholipid acyltransferase family protein [Pseudomonadota bacterium]
MIVSTILSWLVLFIAVMVRPRIGFFERVARLWARSILRVMGITLKVRGMENLGGVSGPFIFMANHQSNLDVPSLIALVPGRFTFIAKDSLRRVPFFGSAARIGGIIFIDRSRRKDAFTTLDRAAETIRSGPSVIVFPEGTRSRDGKLLEFKRGPFYLAMAARVPIVPVAISGTHRLLPPGRLRIRKGEATIAFGKPIPVAENASLASLQKDVRTVVENMVVEWTAAT